MGAFLCISVATKSCTLAWSSFLTYFLGCVHAEMNQPLMGEATLSRAVTTSKKKKKVRPCVAIIKGGPAMSPEVVSGEGPGTLHFGKVPKCIC